MRPSSRAAAGVPAFVWAAVSYVEVIRNTPFLLQIMFIFFGAAFGRDQPEPWPAAILALSLRRGAASQAG